MGKSKELSSGEANDIEIKDVQMLRTNTVSTRLRLAIYAETPEKARFPYLEVHTGIPNSTWRTWWTRGGVPSGALLEAVAKLWPQYAFWLLTGRTDVRCGHDMPALHVAAKGYISNWPEETTVRTKKIKTSFSREYLTTIQELDGAETDSAKTQIRYHTLKLLSKKRCEEINSNFQVKLSFEEDDL